MYSPYDVRNAYPSRHTKAEGKFTPQICRSRIFVLANECARVVPMYPSQSQSAMSHLHSLAHNLPPRTCAHYMLCRLCDWYIRCDSASFRPPPPGLKLRISMYHSPLWAMPKSKAENAVRLERNSTICTHSCWWWAQGSLFSFYSYYRARIKLCCKVQ